MKIKKLVGLIFCVTLLVTQFSSKIGYANEKTEYSIEEYVQMLIEKNEIEDKEYFYCSTMPINSIHSINVEKEIADIQFEKGSNNSLVESDKNQNAIVLLSKSGDEVEQRVIIPCEILEDGSLVNLLSTSAYYEGRELRVTTNSVVNISGAAVYSYYPSNAANSYRGPFYVPRTVSFTFLGAPSGYNVKTIKASFIARHLYHDVTTGNTIANTPYTSVSSVASQYSPSIGTTYSGNYITFPTNYGFPIDSNGLSTYSKLSLELTYTYNNQTYYYTSSVDVFSGESIWDLEDPYITD